MNGETPSAAMHRRVPQLLFRLFLDPVHRRQARGRHERICRGLPQLHGSPSPALDRWSLR